MEKKTSDFECHSECPLNYLLPLTLHNFYCITLNDPSDEHKNMKHILFLVMTWRFFGVFFSVLGKETISSFRILLEFSSFFYFRTFCMHWIYVKMIISYGKIDQSECILHSWISAQFLHSHFLYQLPQFCISCAKIRNKNMKRFLFLFKKEHTATHTWLYNNRNVFFSSSLCISLKKTFLSSKMVKNWINFGIVFVFNCEIVHACHKSAVPFDGQWYIVMQDALLLQNLSAFTAKWAKKSEKICKKHTMYFSLDGRSSQHMKEIEKCILFQKIYIFSCSLWAFDSYLQIYT